MIDNWRPDFAQRFWIVSDDGSDEKLCDQSLFHNASSFHCPVSAPSQGQIRIEPRGRTPQGFARVELSFVLLPIGTHLKWPEQLLQPNDDAIITAHPPEKFRIEWLQDEIESTGLGCWRVPQNIDFIEGQVTYRDGISFPIAGHIYRLALSTTAIKGHVLWHDELKQRVSMQIRLSSAEIGQRIEFGVLSGSQLLNAITLPPVPARGSLDLTTDDIRDAIEALLQPAGMLAIRLSSGRILSTGVTYANEQLLIERLWAENPSREEDWERILPESLRHNIRLIRRLQAGTLDKVVFSTDHLPGSLRDFFDCIGVCWKVFDKGLHIELPDELQNESWRSLLAWFNEARDLISTGVQLTSQTVEQMLRRMPDVASLLPVARWRRAYNRAAEELRKIEDWTDTVKHWRSLCHSEQWAKARESRIGTLPGGKILTDAAKDYFYALERQSIGQQQVARNWFVSAKQKFEQVMSEPKQGIVLEIAAALRPMIFYHLRHPSFRTEADLSIARLPDEWRRFKCMLRRLQGQNLVASCADTLGLADISPHDEDTKLENLTHEPENN